MGRINGNTKAVVQIKEVERDEYQADRVRWKDAFPLHGALDLLDGGINFKMMSRAEDADYIFLCEVYEVELFDDPMSLHEHLEIYLKYLGGQ